MRLKSREGWNFDRLRNLAGEYNHIGETNLCISELFTRGNLHMQVIMHESGRVVGLLVRNENIIMELGCWSSLISYNMYSFAKREKYAIAPVGLMSDLSIDILQSGFDA